MPSNIPALTYDDSSIKPSESVSKIVPVPVPVYLPTIPVQNGDRTDISIKSKPMTNGFNSIPRTNRLNNAHETTPKTSRRTSKERHNVGISSRYPPRTQ